MAHISISELCEVISLSPTHKAPGPSSIPYEWFKVLPDTALEFLCELMNRCLDSSDIPEDWRLASIAPIPKPHEFDALLKNTRPITLLETARKLLVKIINNRLSNILSSHRVLQGNNFAGLPGSSVIYLQIGKIEFSRLMAPPHFITSTIYFDPLLTELSESAISPYCWSSHIPMDVLVLNGNKRNNPIVPVIQLTYMDDSTLLSSSLHALSTSSPITFSLASEFPTLVDNMGLQLTPLKLSSSFRFLGVWFNLQGSPSFVVSQIKDIYNSFASTIRFKKLTSAQLAYLHSAVILPKVHFRSQVTYLPENTLLRIVGSYYGLHKKLLSISRTFPSLALSSKLFTDDVNLYTYLLVTFRTLQVALKWPSPLDNILDFSRWNSSQRSIHHNWIFQTLRILSESGLTIIKLPVGLCLDLMPGQSVPLVTLSPELANSEKATWLSSPLWCLSQLVDPFRQFLFTWTDLNLVPKTGKTPSWFTRFINMPNLISYLLASSDVHAGLDGSDSMIFGQVFYTVDVHGTRIVYFSHWSNSFSNRSVLSPCQGCSLHDASIEDGPLQVRSVGSKLSHRSCLTFLPSYRCLQLFHMPTRYFCVRVPELFLVDSGIPSFVPTTVDVSPQLPTAPPALTPEIHISSHLHIYIYAKKHKVNASSSNGIGCGWIQRDEDTSILASGSFLWTNGPLSPQASELGFIFQVLRLLPSKCSITFYSTHPYTSLYTEFCGSSPERRVRFSCYLLWMAIHNQILASCLDCTFQTIKEVSTDAYLPRCTALVESLSSNDHSYSFNSLLEFSPFWQLLVVSLCNGAPLVIDPVVYWHAFSNMRDFFDIMNLSRFIPLRSSYSSIDWNLTFDLFKETLYHRVDVAQISSALRFRLQLWFDELPLMSRLRFRYPGLYADDSLCPNCGIFMETLEHFFTCSPDEPFDDESPKASNCPRAQLDLDTFNFYWSLVSPRNFLKLHREIYHQLWRPRCKMKSLKDKALDITPTMLRTMKCSDFTNFRFDTSPVTLSLTNESLSPLQASEWSSLGIFWTHSAII
ncbi:hypothetical protein RhiirA4_478085 [Rhizophagus irregularis]|uniref:Reverse transcriptase n=1 Tax=Rhizophagus irregularis TaxID=588596 RepID=A0A2I1HE68_9GLOM|nr:hypothetical protein RhiirA4_478085 [Rhizophagus irregularis]